MANKILSQENKILSQNRDMFRKLPEYKLGDYIYEIYEKREPNKQEIYFQKMYISKIELSETDHNKVSGYGYFPAYTISVESAFIDRKDEVKHERVSGEFIERNFRKDKESAIIEKHNIINNEIRELEKEIEKKRKLIYDK